MVTLAEQKRKLMKERANILKRKSNLMKEKAKLMKEKKELEKLKKEKQELMKLKKEIKKLKQSPEVERYKKLLKKSSKVAGKGLGKFFAGAYKYGELATRPERSKPVRRRKNK